MTKFSFMMVALSATSFTYAAEEQAAKLQALDIDFLLFIEQMERVDQGWIDPLSVENIAVDPSKKLQPSSKNTNVKHPEMKHPEIKTKKTDEQPNNKGVK